MTLKFEFLEFFKFLSPAPEFRFFKHPCPSKIQAHEIKLHNKIFFVFHSCGLCNALQAAKTLPASFKISWHDEMHHFFMLDVHARYNRVSKKKSNIKFETGQEEKYHFSINWATS